MENQDNQQPPVLDYKLPSTDFEESEWRQAPRGCLSICWWVLVTAAGTVCLTSPSLMESRAVHVALAAAPPVGFFIGVTGLIWDRAKWAALGGMFFNGLWCLPFLVRFVMF